MKKSLSVGVFDLVHAGHFNLFWHASQIADEVHVGIASDALAREFKGYDRPFFALRERVYLIQGCKYVDKVHVYGCDTSTKDDNEDALRALVAKVCPDFFVEGEDKKGSDLKGYIEDLGIERVSTPRLGTHVTTSTYIRAIRQEMPVKDRKFIEARDKASRYYRPW